MSKTTGPLLEAALREVCEEAGLRPGNLCLTKQFLGAPHWWSVGIRRLRYSPTG